MINPLYKDSFIESMKAERERLELLLNEHNYKIEKEIGKGGFSDVFIAKHTICQLQFAVKVIKTNQNCENFKNLLKKAIQKNSLSNSSVCDATKLEKYRNTSKIASLSDTVEQMIKELKEEEKKIMLIEKSNYIQNENKRCTFRRECDSLIHLKHPNVINLYEKIETEEFLILVLEYCSKGTIKKFIQGDEWKQMNENERNEIYFQMIEAINYCHQKGIAHLDIKPENILVDFKNKIKLSDFGLSYSSMFQNPIYKKKLIEKNKIFGKENISHFKIKQYAGTALYQPPEIEKKIPYNPLLADIWSLGVTLFELDAQFNPMKRFLKVDWKYFIENHIQNIILKKMLKDMLQEDPLNRIAASQILEMSDKYKTESVDNKENPSSSKNAIKKSKITSIIMPTNLINPTNQIKRKFLVGKIILKNESGNNKAERARNLTFPHYVF